MSSSPVSISLASPHAAPAASEKRTKKEQKKPPSLLSLLQNGIQGLGLGLSPTEECVPWTSLSKQPPSPWQLPWCSSLLLHSQQPQALPWHPPPPCSWGAECSLQLLQYLQQENSRARGIAFWMGERWEAPAPMCCGHPCSSLEICREVLAPPYPQQLLGVRDRRLWDFHGLKARPMSIPQWICPRLLQLLHPASPSPCPQDPQLSSSNMGTCS